MADVYARRLDVVNRGLSGYNTAQALRVLPHCLPPPAHAHVRFLTLFFGANDARVPGSPGGPDQSVSLEDFKRNLRAMVQHPAVRVHPGVRVILITTPPIDERKCAQADREKYPDLGLRDGKLRRTADGARRYAQAVREVGMETGVPVCDIWTAMMVWAGYTPSDDGQRPDGAKTSASSEPSSMSPLVGSMAAPANEMLQSFLEDGLHFSGKGYRVLFDELMALIRREFPDEMPDRLPMVLPVWDDRRAGVEEGERGVGHEA